MHFPHKLTCSLKCRPIDERFSHFFQLNSSNNSGLGLLVRVIATSILKLNPPENYTEVSVESHFVSAHSHFVTSFAFFSISFRHTLKYVHRRNVLISSHSCLLQTQSRVFSSRMQVYDVSFHKGDRRQTWQRLREGNEGDDESRPRGVYSQ